MKRITFEISKGEKQSFKKKCKESGFPSMVTVLRALITGYISGRINVNVTAEMGLQK